MKVTDHERIEKAFLNEIEVQHRPYELRKEESGHFGLITTVTVWVASVLGVIKALFFDEALAQKQTDLPMKYPFAAPEAKHHIKDDLDATFTADLTQIKDQAETTEGGNKNQDHQGKHHLLNGRHDQGQGADDGNKEKPASKEFGYKAKLNTGSHGGDRVEGLGAANVVPFPKVGKDQNLRQDKSGQGAPLLKSSSLNDDDLGEPTEDDDPINRQPFVSAPVVMNPLLQTRSLLLSAPTLLFGASDPDGDALAVKNLTASSGSIIALNETSWRFTPDEEQTEPVVFSYQITDGEIEIEQTASLEIIEEEPEIFTGSEEADLIVGTGGRDQISGLGGDDSLLGQEGSDEINAGDGDDTVFGGSGHDLIHGGSGNDQLFGEAGNDTIYGDAGDDEIHGDEGDDQLFGGDGDDTIFGGVGDDGGFGAGIDDSGNDLLDGGNGVDFLKSDAGNNTFVGGRDNDTAFGGIGEDVFIATINDGDDQYDGGEGSDTYDLSQTTAVLTVDLRTGIAVSSDIGTDSLANMENVVGGSGDDLFIDNHAINHFRGGLGSDTFQFVTGNRGQGGVSRDFIEDFDIGDKIDLSLFDGSDEQAGFQRLNFKYDEAQFSGVGEVRYKFENEGGNDRTIIAINFKDDGDSNPTNDADYEIELSGHHVLTDDNLLT